MVTVRAHCRARDGQIHTDSKGKLITVLVYLNQSWEADGGRLRLLRSPDDIDDYVAEVPPDEGTLLAFRCSDNAWHGHKSFEGPRRAIQLNWVVDDAYLRREQRRHRISAFFKSFRMAS
jgi:Rps23 Pro-64 3,4-dihydroxylase Tpa1-like proline 4-hydroxylase